MSSSLIAILFSATIANNILLIRFLGLCPFFGVSRRVDTALSMGMAVLFVMVLATSASWLIYYFCLQPLGLECLRTMVFILVIAALVQMVEMFLKKSFPALYRAFGVYLPLITTNCAILGTSFLAINNRYDFVQSLVFAAGVALGFLLSLVIFAGMRERLETAPIPAAFRGYPLAFVLAGLMSLSFMGFAGLFGLH